MERMGRNNPTVLLSKYKGTKSKRNRNNAKDVSDAELVQPVG
jgi:hypothetical protein